MTTTINLSIRSAIGESGDFLTREERYEVTHANDGTVGFCELVQAKDGSLVRSYCSYTGFPNVVAFTAARQAEVDKLAAAAAKARIEAGKRRERESDAALAVEAICRAFDLTPNDWAWRMWADVGSDCGSELPALLHAEMALKTPAARALAIRKAMRPLLTDAKQNAREEYPEDYREADDKDDFYADYMDDVTQHIVASIGRP